MKAQSKKGTIQYQSAKEMINIIYGGCCYSRSIFFTLPIAMSITCVGRQIITTANHIVESLGDGYKVICNDTDALTFTIPETVKTFDDCEKIISYLNTIIQSDVRFGPEIKFTTEEIIKQIYNIAKKSYIW